MLFPLNLVSVRSVRTYAEGNAFSSYAKFESTPHLRFQRWLLEMSANTQPVCGNSWCPSGLWYSWWWFIGLRYVSSRFNVRISDKSAGHNCDAGVTLFMECQTIFPAVRALSVTETALHRFPANNHEQHVHHRFNNWWRLRAVFRRKSHVSVDVYVCYRPCCNLRRLETGSLKPQVQTRLAYEILGVVCYRPWYGLAS